MIGSRQIAFSLVTLSGIAVFAILRRKSCPHNVELPDVISQLPDDILVSILTRMPIKSAIRTSILSKRWRNLYKLVSDIKVHSRDLGWHSAHAPEVIIDRLKSYLRLRSGSKIRSFSFDCCLTKSYAFQFEQCIYFLGTLGVEELAIYFCSHCRRSSDVSFSCHLLSEMPSLKYFTLLSCSLRPNLKSQYNSLQTLRLSYVAVLPGAFECILSNCLSLHSLIIFRCDFPSKIRFCGPNLQLKSLMIQDCRDVEEIEFYASNLLTFEFQSPQMVNFIFDHVPLLQSIFLYIESINIMPYVFGALAKDLPHLKSLAFQNKADLYQVSRRIMDMGIETFSNLRQLEIGLLCPPKTNLFALTPILQSCPLLQEFHLETPNLEYDGVQLTKHIVLHSELKKVEIRGFSGIENEIEFALYILRSALILEQMQISRCTKYYVGRGTWRKLRKTPWCEETDKKIRKRLQGQAISKTAQVIIQYAC